MGVCSVCGCDAGEKRRRCRACHAEYMRTKRAGLVPESPRVTVAIVELEEVDTGSPAFVVCVAPNNAALAQGWVDKTYELPTLEEAQAKAKFVCDALEVYNDCTSGQLEVAV